MIGDIIAGLMLPFSVICIIILKIKDKRTAERRKEWQVTDETRRIIKSVLANDYFLIAYQRRWVHLKEEGRERWVTCATNVEKGPKEDLEDGWGSRFDQPDNLDYRRRKNPVDDN